MHFSQGKIKQNSCLIHVMNILFSSNTLSRCFPGEIHILHKHKHIGSECEKLVDKVLHFASLLMSVREHMRTHKPVRNGTYFHENPSHTPHL